MFRLPQANRRVTLLQIVFRELDEDVENAKLRRQNHGVEVGSRGGLRSHIGLVHSGDKVEGVGIEGPELLDVLILEHGVGPNWCEIISHTVPSHLSVKSRAAAAAHREFACL